jgi:hypothetical protein
MFTPRLTLVSSLLAIAIVNAASTAGPIVDLGYAKYQGVSNSTTGLNTFLGIRYAAARQVSVLFYKRTG